MLCPHPCYEAQGGGNANGQEGLHVMVHYDLSNLFEKSRSLWCFNPPWILEPSATGLCKPDLHVFAKLFEDRLERGLEAQAFSGREIGGDDDVLNFFVGHLVDVDLTRQPAS
jgi:hypothetical protein